MGGRGRKDRGLHEKAPTVFPRGQYYAVDLRRWNAGRPTMRNPDHPRWPECGEKTEHEDVAKEWAWAYLRHFQRKKHNRQRGIPERLPTIKEATDKWMRHRERTMEPSTVEQSQTTVNHLLDHLGGSHTLEAVSTARLQEWFNDKLDAGYRVSTLKNYRSYMGALLDYFGRAEIARNVELPNTGDFDPKAWTDEEIGRLMRSAGRIGPEHERLVAVGMATGARRNELAALRWSDLDRRRHTVRIERQVRKVGRSIKTLKGKRARTALVLPGWWEHHEPEGEYVIGGDRPVPETTMQQMMTEILNAAGLNEMGVSLHSLRHTYARLFLEGGGSLEQLQRFLGHASITTTQQSYGHFGDEAAVRLAREQFYP